jgi:hypothetical protein
MTAAVSHTPERGVAIRPQKEQALTVEMVRSRYTYDAESGLLYSKKRGLPVGSLSKEGKLRFQLKKANYLVHRVIWLYVHGEWPKQQIDHINGIGTDNRLCNLRDVPARINTQNRRAESPNTATGFVGVKKELRCKSFSARITVDGKRLHLGMFDSAEAASRAYVMAKRELHEGCTI